MRGGQHRDGWCQADSSERPLRRRAARIARPARVRIRRRKPWVLARRRLFGWKVRLLTMVSKYFGASAEVRPGRMCPCSTAPVPTSSTRPTSGHASRSHQEGWSTLRRARPGIKPGGRSGRSGHPSQQEPGSPAPTLILLRPASMRSRSDVDPAPARSGRPLSSTLDASGSARSPPRGRPTAAPVDKSPSEQDSFGRGPRDHGPASVTHRCGQVCGRTTAACDTRPPRFTTAAR